jgi:hypothetical protein
VVRAGLSSAPTAPPPPGLQLPSGLGTHPTVSLEAGVAQRTLMHPAERPRLYWS